MRLRLLTLVLLSGLATACDAPRPPPPATAPTPTQSQPAPAPLTPQQQTDLAAQCERKSGERFRRDWPGRPAAEYSAHYNRKLKSCFYIVTITDTKRSKSLVDIGENEVYGEYTGPLEAPGETTPAAQIPTACRVESMYCASEREWNVLVARYLETD